MQIALEEYFNGICCPAIVATYNFDVDSSNWTLAGVTDKSSFDSKYGVTSDFFALNGNNIKANITSVPLIQGFTPEYVLQISNSYITNVNLISIPNLDMLNLSNNNIINFNPSSALPSSLKKLFLENNQIVTFNPSIALPSSLFFLIISHNQMNLAGYTASEIWANGLHTTTNGYIQLTNNLDSVSETNLESILIAKGWQIGS